MSIRRFQGALMVVGIVAFSGACMAETFEELEKKIDTAYKKLSSVSGKLVMETKVAQAGFEISQTMTGTVEHLRKGEKIMFRMEGDATTVQKMGETETKQSVKTLMVSDGDIMYTVNDSDGKKQVMKIKAQPDQMPWEGMRATSNFKILPEEKVEGKDAYVIEASPKTKKTGDQSRTVYYCLKECGYPVKFVTYGADGKVMSTMTMSELKLNAGIPESRFKYQVPEGVQVMDMTGS